jgi:hypothetical protein
MSFLFVFPEGFPRVVCDPADSIADPCMASESRADEVLISYLSRRVPVSSELIFLT